MTGYIYILIDPDSLLSRYVGQTIKKPTSRWKNHLKEKGETYKCYWIQSLLKQGKQPMFEVIEVLPNVTKEQLNAWERMYICRLKKLGHPLTNMTLGGEGTWGYRFNEEQLTKHKNVMKIIANSDVGREQRRRINKGREHSVEHSRKQSLGLQGKPKSEVHRKNLSLSLQGCIPWNKGKTGYLSAASLKRMGDPQRGLKTKESNDKRRATMLGTKQRPETLEKKRISMLRYHRGSI